MPEKNIIIDEQKQSLESQEKRLKAYIKVIKTLEGGKNNA